MLPLAFEGHRLYKIGNDWVFDLTEFIGYRITSINGEVKSYDTAFRVRLDSDNMHYSFERYTTIPVGVMRKTKEIIENYMKEAMING